MTEANKERIVKYWNIASDKKLVNFEGVAEVLNEFYNSDYLMSINCSIAEVEAVIELLKHYRTFDTPLEYLHKELAELKQLLV